MTKKERVKPQKYIRTFIWRKYRLFINVTSFKDAYYRDVHTLMNIHTCNCFCRSRNTTVFIIVVCLLPFKVDWFTLRIFYINIFDIYLLQYKYIVWPFLWNISWKIQCSVWLNNNMYMINNIFCSITLYQVRYNDKLYGYHCDMVLW